jgi:sec-independent protein translocase protein TatA
MILESGFSMWQLLILLIVVAMVFGTKRLRTLGGDVGEAIKGFRSALSEEDKTVEKAKEPQTLDGVVEHRERDSQKTR